MQSASSIFRELFTGSVTLQYCALWICHSSRTPALVLPGLSLGTIFLWPSFSLPGDSHCALRLPFPLPEGPCWPSAEHRISCLAFSGNPPCSLLSVCWEALMALTNQPSLLSHSYSGFETSLVLNLLLAEFYLLLPLFRIPFLRKVWFA